MKRNLFILALLCLFAVSCVEEGKVVVTKPVSVSGVSFKNVDLKGVGALALAAPGEVAKSTAVTKADEGEKGIYLLYKVNEDGTLVEVDYTITVETDGDQDVVEEAVTAYLKLAMECIYTIGDKWLWLYNCRYYCENLEQIENETLRNSVIKLIDDFGTGHSFLVRRSDGALFPWDDVSNPAAFMVKFNWMKQSDVDQIVKNVGDDIVSSIYSDGNGNKLYYIEDKGDVLEVKKLLNDSVWAFGEIFPVPGEDAFLCNISDVNGYVVLFPKTATIKFISNDNLLVEPSIYSLMTYDNRFFADICGEDAFNRGHENYVYWLHLDSSGEDVYLFEDRICSIILEKEEVVYLREASSYNENFYFKLKADENDPMCFDCINTSFKHPSEVGITLPPGKYEFFLSGDVWLQENMKLYVDRSGERTHLVGPFHYIHFLTVDTAAQTASWDELYMSYWGLDNYSFHLNGDSLQIDAVSDGVACSVLLDLVSREYSYKTCKVPDDFPSEGWEYIGWNSYKIMGTSAIVIYSLETMQKETIPIVMTELPSDIVGNIEWNFDDSKLMFWGVAKTLEGDVITIYIPVTGDNRGVARISIEEASGAGDNVAQIIRLN